MPNVVGVQFQKAGKLEYYAPNHLDVKVGDQVVVESKRGIEIGLVKFPPKELDNEDVTLPLKEIIRLVTNEDKTTYDNNERDALKALELCKRVVKEQRLDMRLVNCEYTLDKSKVIFNFTADDRIDFRKLVKILAQNLKTRIELRQIGVRDEAKLLGGIGPCGRSLCCSTFLGDFEPVSIKMAKDQNLSLNPTKISGACGRLMCCLKYENDYYEEARSQLPDIGDTIHTPDGNGKVVGLNILDISMQVKIEGLKQPLEYRMEEIEALN
ncbi:stage 0 sporulation family protein [Staphylococcus saccharolyticus]|uniref:PSP1 domain-containing protein n=1 Tax=Staphylococcus saccharolyticus TaxID=33028 RepID=UPI00102DBC35|nr:stage 0 sporulation family protein [Staphylococcus saccharolyticus]MBL7574213.1 stage 0 sporulation family protein [Staphylococcus saccharolyticus]MBL7585266.1 stage 0 sporulation family protein [Staphylococcus saccharolyticus]MBL7639825.1 stage 0 sporulation family protein [Staphylococcus saccharolyticus]QRJ68345.1 stage 0 sporulation family protein [Staphylococcus saccharolyticus]TAA90831.1 signal peptidase II [Staphylococcus saccharolyticus]